MASPREPIPSAPAPRPGTRLRPTDALLAVAAGFAVFRLACRLESPGDVAFSFGCVYEAMANDPLAGAGMFPHRVLLPLLAWAAHGLGVPFVAFSHATTVLLLATVCIACLRLGAARVDAVLVTVVVGVTETILLYQKHVGYPDQLTFALLIAALLAVRRGAWFWGINLLSAFNHEQVFFLLPFLGFVRRRVAAPGWRAEAIGFAIMAGGYGGFRLWVAARATAAAIAPGFYLDNGYFPFGFLGLSLLAILQIAIAFGPLLVVLGWAARRRAAGWETTALLLLVGGVFAELLVAHDMMRFVNFLFVPLAFAALRFVRAPSGRAWLAGVIVAQALAYRYVLWPVTEAMARRMYECGALTGNARDVAKLWTCVAPQVWWWYLLAALAIAALVAAGAWAAGRRSAPR